MGLRKRAMWASRRGFQGDGTQALKFGAMLDTHAANQLLHNHSVMLGILWVGNLDGHSGGAPPCSLELGPHLGGELGLI